MTLVRVELAERVATVTIDRPEALNAISTELALELAAAVEPLGVDPEVRAVVLTGAGERAFCVGADLKQRAGFDDHGWFVQREAFRRGFAAVRRCPLPTVAAVAGFALGGGTELALACDLVVAAEDATFGLPEVRLGLVPAGGGTQLLVRRVGRSVARDLVLTGRRVGADEALRLGLADRVVPAAEVRAAATALAAGIAANAPTAVRMAKWALEVGADLPLEAAMEVEDQAWRRAVLSEDRREGIAAWVEKREPHWPGRGARLEPPGPPLAGGLAAAAGFHGGQVELEPDRPAVRAAVHAPAVREGVEQVQPAAGHRLRVVDPAAGAGGAASVMHLDPQQVLGDQVLDREAAVLARGRVEQGVGRGLADQQPADVAGGPAALDGGGDKAAGGRHLLGVPAELPTTLRLQLPRFRRPVAAYGTSSVSSSTTIWPATTGPPTADLTPTTVPENGASSGVSIFMASTTASSCPPATR